MTARIETVLSAQLERMERTRIHRVTHRRPLRETHIALSHGSGGKSSHDLLEGLIFPALGQSSTGSRDDAAVLSAAVTDRIAFTTDCYVVSPLVFPGGDIGRLAVHGTVNDLAMAGAVPLAISLALILEEGLEVALLRSILQSTAEAAAEAGVQIVTGDTKVVPRGKADGIFINTAGIGRIRDGIQLSPAAATPGDRVLLSGHAGDHGMAIMLARESFELDAGIESDTAPLAELAGALLAAAPGTRAMRDPTRGGIATSLNEIAQRAGVGVVIEEEVVPVRQAVRGACELLGLDPLHIANEGKLLAIVPPAECDAALAALRSHRLGAAAVVIGQVVEEPAGMVLCRTSSGGSRVLDMLAGDPLPRIC
ncbi:MAG: hydrogenase expression/formation protein HypE [Gemmatimonadota bacterium]